MTINNLPTGIPLADASKNASLPWQSFFLAASNHTSGVSGPPSGLPITVEGGSAAPEWNAFFRSFQQANPSLPLPPGDPLVDQNGEATPRWHSFFLKLSNTL